MRSIDKHTEKIDVFSFVVALFFYEAQNELRKGLTSCFELGGVSTKESTIDVRYLLVGFIGYIPIPSKDSERIDDTRYQILRRVSRRNTG